MLRLKFKVQSPKSKVGKRAIYGLLLTAFCLLTFGCRYDMQDQPRYKAYKQSDFFSDGRASRDLPAGTVPRGFLRENKALFTGKKENADPNAPVATTTDATGNTLVSSFPNDVTEFPMPITEEIINRGEERYKVFCMMCHGPTGNGDGMIVRRGFSKPPTYHDDRLRNAPVGHFYDVITNGQGKMNGYAAQIPPADRWAIVTYIRTLQISQDPTGTMAMTSSRTTNTNTATPNPSVPGTPIAPPNDATGGMR